MRWKDGWKVRATLNRSSVRANQKRHCCFDGYPQVNRAGIRNCQTEGRRSPPSEFLARECPRTAIFPVSKSLLAYFGTRQSRYGSKAIHQRLIMNRFAKFPLAAICIVPLLFAASSLSAESDGIPRTGYFKVEFSPQELLGEQGVIDAADILRSDDNISWQLYVPDTYDATRPAGVVVYVSPTCGGQTRSISRGHLHCGCRKLGNNNATSETGYRQAELSCVSDGHE